MDAIRENRALTGALARRHRHRRRPLAVRTLNVAAAALLVAASVEVYLRFGFAPPLVLPVVVALLALEFHWAARLAAWGINRFARYASWFRRASRRA